MKGSKMTKKEWIIITIVKLWKKSSKLIFFKIEGKKMQLKQWILILGSYLKIQIKRILQSYKNYINLQQKYSKSIIILLRKKNSLKSFDI